MSAEIQVVIAPPLREAFEAWLKSLGFYLAGPLPLDGDDLPTYIIGIVSESA